LRSSFDVLTNLIGAKVAENMSTAQGASQIQGGRGLDWSAWETSKHQHSILPFFAVHPNAGTSRDGWLHQVAQNSITSALPPAGISGEPDSVAPRPHGRRFLSESDSGQYWDRGDEEYEVRPSEGNTA
jgi:hypothetical protein